MKLYLMFYAQKCWMHCGLWGLVSSAYCGRLHAERTSAYLPRALQEMLEGTLGVFGDRLGKLLFKLVVEHNMTNHLLGGDIDMTRDEYNKMRGNSVREVAGTRA